MTSLRRASLAAVLLALAVALPRTAHADEPDEPAPASSTPHWYGAQTLIVDGASLLTAPLGVGIGGLVLGAPIVHLVHDRPYAALASLGLRTVLPVVGGYLGLSAAGTCHEQRESGDFLGPCFLHGFDELVIGALVGVSIAVAVDASVLAYEPARAAEQHVSDRPRVTSVAPSIDPITKSASVGLGGTF
ncbi:MAG: hypothetical protein JWP87_184 [Labilithrix sp.]|nr:hypothetical protein [Labilithrix sp.]